MQTIRIEEALEMEGVPKAEIKRYINYLEQLQAERGRDGIPKNAWFKRIEEHQWIDIFINTLASSGLPIDGESILLVYRKKLMVTYTYQAYKNRLIMVYPESMIDISLVREGDTYFFKKEDGKVSYTHIPTDPFSGTPGAIVGAYCIIKNKRGHFLETINQEDIQKMRSVAKTQTIWDMWEDRMVLKSVIKRGCKLHFNDITGELDELDNQEYDLEKAGLEPDIQREIEQAGTLDELQRIYDEKKDLTEHQPAMMVMLKQRKKEIKAQAS